MQLNPGGSVSMHPCFTEVMSHGCDLHDTHTASERGITRGDFVNQMFCATAVLRSGPVWMDIKGAMILCKTEKSSVDQLTGHPVVSIFIISY